MKLIERCTGITLIIFGILQGVFILTQKVVSPFPESLPTKELFNVSSPLASTNMPFYAGICILAGVLLIYLSQDKE